MAAKNKQNKKQLKRNSTIMMYARALNLHSIEAYQQWCVEQGFSTSVNKTQNQLERELKKYKHHSAVQKLKQYKREENRHHLIEKIYANKISYADLNSDALKLISRAFKNAQNKRLLRDVLLYLDEKTKLLTHEDYIKAVISFVAHHALWLRPLLQWQPKTCNAQRQFSSLVRYLFAQYEVPAFMDSVWYKGSGKAKGWFIHLGRGKNIRSASSLPIKMSKKMAHFFTQAPAHYDIYAAFRWAQIHALGGNRVIADAIAETRLVREFKDDEFCLSVLRFFIDNPLLDCSQYNPIIDYIWHQKYENRVVFIDRGIAREEGPVHAGFSMHGRTPATLLHQVELWHRQLGKELRGGNLQWRKSKYMDFNYIEGHVNSRNMKKWTISELLSSHELIAEGRKLHHCVASYARSCFSGKASIWTMELQMSQQKQKLLTIEVHNSAKSIRQIRGLHNRMASNMEMDIIYRWALKEGFSMT